MWTKDTPFAPPQPATQQEGGTVFAPRFDQDGLIAAIAQDAETGAVLMLAYMNAESLARTIATGEAWYWSRSRKAFWRKGETSGHTQQVLAIETDCDQDALLLKVRQQGPACHTNRRSCFYRKLPAGQGATLTFIDDQDA